MAFIYKITNNNNDMAYIGKTEESVEKRWKEHCKDYKRPRCEKRPLYNAMNKYGPEQFSVEMIEETENPEEREKYWIEFYDTYKNGYNATRGGDGKAYVDSEQYLDLWNQGKTLNEIQDITGNCKDTISGYLKKFGISHKEIRNRSYAFQRKPVAQIDLDTGDIIGVFESSIAAGKHIGKKGGHIRHVCNGDREAAYGYGWEYMENIAEKLEKTFSGGK